MMAVNMAQKRAKKAQRRKQIGDIGQTRGRDLQ